MIRTTSLASFWSRTCRIAYRVALEDLRDMRREAGDADTLAYILRVSRGEALHWSTYLAWTGADRSRR